VSDPVQP